ncbi:hypothetical protein MBLNU13_g10262t1 [Cladosporium sp. NU13]
MPFTSYECAVCLEDRTEREHAVRTIADDPICSDCISGILDLFIDALKCEINFPPRWGPIEIPFESFEDLFSDEFRLAYREKAREYTTSIPKRVYCQHKISSKDKSAGQAEADFCNTFMGSVEAKGISRCSGCTKWTCMECRDTALAPLAVHTCTTKAASRSETESKAFDAARKGIDYQVCPNPACKIKVGLKDGCNAMTCACNTFFCFVCGEEADHDSGHWTEGKPCPRWGALDGSNPIHDRPAIVAQPGFPLILIPVEGPQAVPNPQNAFIAFAHSDRLYMDSEESLTLLEEIASEQFWMEDASGQISQPILDMKELFRSWHQNFEWLKLDAALAGADPRVARLVVDPVDQAIGTTNFFIRDKILQAKFREAHAASLEISGEDSVLFTVPVMEIFERYNTVHKPRLIHHVQVFEAARNVGRAVWAEQEHQFAMDMFRRQRQEDGEEELPHRRASI